MKKASANQSVRSHECESALHCHKLGFSRLCSNRIIFVSLQTLAQDPAHLARNDRYKPKSVYNQKSHLTKKGYVPASKGLTLHIHKGLSLLYFAHKPDKHCAILSVLRAPAETFMFATINVK